MKSKKIRVLVVDDSLMFREVITKGINLSSGIEVVGKAADPFEARDKLLELEPDVMICDVIMPKMSGVDFIRRLLPQYPIPVIVVSSADDAVIDSLNAGAIDFVLKPNNNKLNEFINELIEKIKIAASSKVMIEKQIDNKGLNKKEELVSNRIIAIGASTGGVEALHNILTQLPQNVPGIVVVQHIPPVFSKMFAQRLDNQLNLNVKEAKTGDVIEPGKVLIAPGNNHMRVKKYQNKFIVEIFQDKRVNGHCPSVDILFESVAKEVGNKSIGIILTGMGYDGAKGLLEMKKSGARTIGQDEKSSVVYGMPKVAYEIGAVEKKAPLAKIPEVLLSMLK